MSVALAVLGAATLFALLGAVSRLSASRSLEHAGSGCADPATCGSCAAPCRDPEVPDDVR